MRFAVIGLFGAYSVASAVSAVSACADAFSLGTTGAWAGAGFALLKVAVFATFAVLVGVRPPAKQTNRDRVAIVACAAAFVSIALLQAPDASEGGLAQLAGELIAFAGMAWLFVSVLSLGRCFGVLPEARGLVTRGPYRLVRHPVYLGELAACFGLTLAAPSARNLAVALAFAVAQAVRMRLEEQALSARFPEYADYSKRTPRLVPRLAFGSPG